MTKRIASLLLLAMVASTIVAQSIINVQDISRANDIFTNSGDSALIMVRGHKSIELKFYLSKGSESSKTQPFNPSRTEIDASEDSIYYFVFPTGPKYRGQTLTIASIDGSSVPVDIDLEPKQVKTYRVSRPFNLIIEKCYIKHRDKALEEIGKGHFTEALDELRLANDCFDKDSVENAKNIGYVNMLIKRRRNGDEAYEKRNYKEASEHYMFLHYLNPSDTLSEKRYKACQDWLTYERNKLHDKAVQSYNSKDYKNAESLFNEVISKSDELDNVYNRNNYKSQATEWLNKIDYENIRMNEKKIRRSTFKHSLIYEYRKDTPIGFSYSSLTNSKTGGFIQIDLNTMLFEEFRSECKYGDTRFAEFNLGLGWTRKLFNFLWIHYGPGLTFKIYHGSYQGSKYPKIGYGESDLLDLNYMGEDVSLPKDEIPEKYEKGWKKANTAFAISPVVGIDLKIHFIVLRLTYQYRFATDAKLGDFIGRNRISFGAGVAF